MLSILFRTALVLLLLTPATQARAAELPVYDIRVGLQGTNTRVVVETGTPVSVTVSDGQLGTIQLGPFRYSGETPAARASSGINGISIQPNAGTISLSFIKPMRLVQKLALDSIEHPKAKRLVFDFAAAAGVTDKGPSPVDMNPSFSPTGRVLDPPRTLGQIREPVRQLPAHRPVAQATVSTPAVAPISKTVVTTDKPVAMSDPIEDIKDQIAPKQDVAPRYKMDMRPLVVVIDAGHGGKDPGARSPSGLLEKNITLAMARALGDDLRRRGYTVYLTRDTDIFIPLRGRVDIGRKHKADLFISVHADSMGNGSRTTRGASVYTLSDVASDKESEKLAARENQADIIGGIDLSHEDKDVANILIDLAMRDTMNQSKKLANSLVSEFNGAGLFMLTPAHRFAGFAVLKAADVPSILIELGFLSNPSEAEALNDPSYRARLARSIADSVAVYNDRYRPQN